MCESNGCGPQETNFGSCTFRSAANKSTSTSHNLKIRLKTKWLIFQSWDILSLRDCASAMTFKVPGKWHGEMDNWRSSHQRAISIPNVFNREDLVPPILLMYDTATTLSINTSIEISRDCLAKEISALKAVFYSSSLICKLVWASSQGPPFGTSLKVAPHPVKDASEFINKSGSDLKKFRPLLFSRLLTH